MTEQQPPDAPDPNTPPPAYGQPPQYGSPPQYGGPPQYSGGPYDGAMPGRGPGDPAPMGLRLVARIIDAILVGAVALLIAHLAGIHLLHHETVVKNGTLTREVRFRSSGSHFIEFAVVQLVVSGLYEISLLTTRGATLGKMLLGVKVVQVESRELPRVQQAATRWVIPAILGLVPVVGVLAEAVLFLSPFFDSTKRNRGWYDKAAGTIATRVR